jgi:hypothetical protein
MKQNSFFKKDEAYIKAKDQIERILIKLNVSLPSNIIETCNVKEKLFLLTIFKAHYKKLKYMLNMPECLYIKDISETHQLSTLLPNLLTLPDNLRKTYLENFANSTNSFFIVNTLFNYLNNIIPRYKLVQKAQQYEAVPNTPLLQSKTLSHILVENPSAKLDLNFVRKTDKTYETHPRLNTFTEANTIEITNNKLIINYDNGSDLQINEKQNSYVIFSKYKWKEIIDYEKDDYLYNQLKCDTEFEKEYIITPDFTQNIYLNILRKLTPDKQQIILRKQAIKVIKNIKNSDILIDLDDSSELIIQLNEHRKNRENMELLLYSTKYGNKLYNDIKEENNIYANYDVLYKSEQDKRLYKNEDLLTEIQNIQQDIYSKVIIYINSLYEEIHTVKTEQVKNKIINEFMKYLKDILEKAEHNIFVKYDNIPDNKNLYEVFIKDITYTVFKNKIMELEKQLEKDIKYIIYNSKSPVYLLYDYERIKTILLSNYNDNQQIIKTLEEFCKLYLKYNRYNELLDKLIIFYNAKLSGFIELNLQIINKYLFLSRYVPEMYVIKYIKPLSEVNNIAEKKSDEHITKTDQYNILDQYVSDQCPLLIIGEKEIIEPYKKSSKFTVIDLPSAKHEEHSWFDLTYKSPITDKIHIYTELKKKEQTCKNGILGAYIHSFEKGFTPHFVFSNTDKVIKNRKYFYSNIFCGFIIVKTIKKLPENPTQEYNIILVRIWDVKIKAFRLIELGGNLITMPKIIEYPIDILTKLVMLKYMGYVFYRASENVYLIGNKNSKPSQLQPVSLCKTFSKTYRTMYFWRNQIKSEPFNLYNKKVSEGEPDYIEPANQCKSMPTDDELDYVEPHSKNYEEEKQNLNITRALAVRCCENKKVLDFANNMRKNMVALIQQIDPVNNTQKAMEKKYAENAKSDLCEMTQAPKNIMSDNLNLGENHSVLVQLSRKCYSELYLFLIYTLKILDNSKDILQYKVNATNTIIYSNNFLLKTMADYSVGVAGTNQILYELIEESIKEKRKIADMEHLIGSRLFLQKLFNCANGRIIPYRIPRTENKKLYRLTKLQKQFVPELSEQERQYFITNDKCEGDIRNIDSGGLRYQINPKSTFGKFITKYNIYGIAGMSGWTDMVYCATKLFSDFNLELLILACIGDLCYFPHHSIYEILVILMIDPDFPEEEKIKLTSNDAIYNYINRLLEKYT